MTTISNRLAALEQVQRRARPELLLFYRTEQAGAPSPEQAAQIALAERQGQGVGLFKSFAPKN